MVVWMGLMRERDVSQLGGCSMSRSAVWVRAESHLQQPEGGTVQAENRGGRCAGREAVCEAPSGPSSEALCNGDVSRGALKSITCQA